MTDIHALRAKVDGFLKQALRETDGEGRARLIGKATYWHQAILKNETAVRRAELDTFFRR